MGSSLRRTGVRGMMLFYICLSFLLGAEANIKGELCTDISTYSPVEYNAGGSCCKVPLGRPQCQTQRRRECIQVEETICKAEEVDSFTMSECTVNTTMVSFTTQSFTPRSMVVEPHSIQHTKFNFSCQNKTRQNCETIWVTKENGEKESVPGTCEPVVWLDCTKTPYNASFETVRHREVALPKLQYETCQEMVVQNKQMCAQTKKAVVSVCETVTKTKCASVEDTLCKPSLGKKLCEESSKVPSQTRIHKEKCLTPEHDSHQTQIGEENHGKPLQRFPFGQTTLDKDSKQGREFLQPPATNSNFTKQTRKYDIFSADPKDNEIQIKQNLEDVILNLDESSGFGEEKEEKETLMQRPMMLKRGERQNTQIGEEKEEKETLIQRLVLLKRGEQQNALFGEEKEEKETLIQRLLMLRRGERQNALWR